MSGRVKFQGSQRKLNIDGEVKLDGHIVDTCKIKYQREIAFVPQDESIVPTCTPREAIRFSAKLRLPKSTSEQEIQEMVSLTLSNLGLTKCADTMVGGGLIKGISGGERKRTSVGVELVTKPTIVFLDEPTSGLVSFFFFTLSHTIRLMMHLKFLLFVYIVS